MSLLLRQALDALRGIPFTEPQYPTDAYLQLTEAARQGARAAAELAVAADQGGQVVAAQLGQEAAAELRRIATAAERLAPIFAPPSEDTAR